MLRTLGCITTQHDLWLVGLAAAICLFACVTTVRLLDSSSRITSSRAGFWLAGAALSFGGGVWATHFVAMLAFRPGLPMSFDVTLTVLSIIIALAFSGVGFVVASRLGRPTIGGAVLGIGVAAMHFVGMAAVRAAAHLQWDWSYVVASVIWGVVFCAAALAIRVPSESRLRLIAAPLALMLGICGLHFTAMTAVILVPDPLISIPASAIEPQILAYSIAGVSLVILALGLSGSLIDQKVSKRLAVEADRLRASVRQLKLTEADLKDTTAQLQEALALAEHAAYFDGLTGLANRARCQADLTQMIEQAGADDEFAVIQIDLDNFKQINDTWGHGAGDHLLRVIADRLRLIASHFKGFTPYRWGGDEFIAVAMRQDYDELKLICEELNDLLGVPMRFQGSLLRPTASIGVARYPQDAQTLDELMTYSDLALYGTKEAGRDGYNLFTGQLKEKFVRNVKIEQGLHVALREGQIEMHFQPQVSIADGSITGLEALARWHHPEWGAVSPAEFIPVAEDSGLGPLLGRYVIDKSFAAARKWIDRDVAFGRLAINLSPQHLKRSTFVDDFFAAAERHNVDARFVAVEILESYLFEETNRHVLEVLETLRERGVWVELDDFGTGYASLSHLASLPVNGIKIDSSFIRSMTLDVKQESIVSSLIAMSNMMGLHVVCEGVETSEQLAALSHLKTGSIQGYLIAKAMPFDAVSEWIDSGQHFKSMSPSSVAPAAS